MKWALMLIVIDVVNGTTEFKDYGVYNTKSECDYVGRTTVVNGIKPYWQCTPTSK